MRVLLINPPRFNEIIGNNPAIIEEERGRNPPLGLLYLAGTLEERTGHEVFVIDAQVEELDYDSLGSRIAAVKPDATGVSAMTMTMIDVMKTLKVVKRVDSGITTVLGGPHVHLYPTETIGLPHVDFLVLGEGEETFRRLLDHLDHLPALEKIPGLVFRTGEGRVVNTGAPSRIGNLDRLPFPARHLVPYERYSSLLSRKGMMTTIFTSRGCPFRCAFCDRPTLGKKFRARSPENVVDEIEQCTEMGIREFLFYDDTFTVLRDRAIGICDEIVRRGLRIGWDIRARVDTVDEVMLKALKRAGCQGIHYGVEAGTEKALRALNKRITIPQAREVFDLTRKHRIPILAYFMIGNPTETLEDIRTTFRVARMLRPDFIHLTILTPFPGTEIYRDGLERGVIERDFWREFAARPSPGFVPPHWGENFSRAELQDLLIEGYRQFYLRPGYVLKRLGSVRSLAELKKKAKAGVKVFAMKSGGEG